MKRQIIFKPLSFLALLIFLFMSCNNIEKDWGKAKEANSIAGYNEFINNYSDSIYNKLAKNAIDSLQWVEDSLSKDTTNLKKYFISGKTSKHSKTAQDMFLIIKGSFIDSRDGKVYKIVKIGNQIWMAENLNYTTKTGSWCYNNDSHNCVKYGRLYNFEAALAACPFGWHLPRTQEWWELLRFVTKDEDTGYQLKSKSGWQKDGYGKTADDDVAIDSYGFSALPGGRRYSWDGGKFTNIGTNGDWWSSTESDGGVVVIGMSGSYRGFYDMNATKDVAHSVRCIKD
jgi:uncharacterized protein (TIGR02145 family)